MGPSRNFCWKMLFWPLINKPGTCGSRDLLWTELCFPQIWWSLDPYCDGVWRWGLWEGLWFRWGHEGGALSKELVSFYLFIYLFIYLFLLFRAAPMAYGGFQARGQIRATAASLHHSHSNAGSLTHWAGPGIEPETSWILVGFISTVPLWNSWISVFLRRDAWQLDLSATWEHSEKTKEMV